MMVGKLVSCAVNQGEVFDDLAYTCPLLMRVTYYAICCRRHVLQHPVTFARQHHPNIPPESCVVCRTSQTCIPFR